jgi:hypothetical protein
MDKMKTLKNYTSYKISPEACPRIFLSGNRNDKTGVFQMSQNMGRGAVQRVKVVVFALPLSAFVVHLSGAIAALPFSKVAWQPEPHPPIPVQLRWVGLMTKLPPVEKMQER